MLNYRKVAAAAVIGSLIISASPVLAEDPLTALMDNIIEVAGEGADQVTEETEDIQDIQEEAIPEEEINIEAEISEPAAPSGENSLCGRWYSVSYEGNSDYHVMGEYFFMPDLMLYDENMTLIAALTPSDTEGVWTMDVPADLAENVSSIRIEAGTLEAPAEISSIIDYVQNNAGSDCLRLVITALSKNNPLAGDEETVNLFLRFNTQYEFLENWMTGKIWKIGDNTLTIGTDGSLDLNGGKATGSCGFTYDDTHSMLAKFRWDGGSSSIAYAPSGFTANSLTLTNIDDPSEVMELVCEGEAPAAEAESDTAA